MVRRYQVWFQTSGRAARCGLVACAALIALGACAGRAAGSSFTAYVTRSALGEVGMLTPVETATKGP